MQELYSCNEKSASFKFERYERIVFIKNAGFESERKCMNSWWWYHKLKIVLKRKIVDKKLYFDEIFCCQVKKGCMIETFLLSKWFWSLAKRSFDYLMIIFQTSNILSQCQSIKLLLNYINSDKNIVHFYVEKFAYFSIIMLLSNKFHLSSAKIAFFPNFNVS